jgi:ATP-dependent protease ClpP protease subunit
MRNTTVLNKALPVHHTATVEGEWDGPAAVAAMPNKASVLQYCHAWQDSDSVDSDTNDDDNDADDKKSAYKFPHHKTKGGPAFLAGVRNALARLEGSSIPEGDKDGVRKHLQAHLDDAHSDEPANKLRRTPTVGKVSNRGFRIVNGSGKGTAEIYLYDEITPMWGVSASEFTAQLNAVDAPEITLHVNSPGGDVFEGIAIYNALKGCGKPVHALIEGLAASAASFVVMAADRIGIARNAQMMIHNAQGLVIGDATAMADTARMLERQSANIADIYAQRTGHSADHWLNLMDAETWYIGQEAVDAGLADEVTGTGPENKWELSYSNRAKRPASRQVIEVADLDQELPAGFFSEAFHNAFNRGGNS